MKKRLDLFLVEKNLIETRSRAQSLIKLGAISIDGKKICKCSELIDINSNLTIDNEHKNWVSRGALKLEHALDKFNIDVKNFTCIDLGASTGGFTEVLISRNIKKVFSVDVGTDQMHNSLLDNKKIINIQKTNAKNLTAKIITNKIDLIVCDVSFISMKKIIEPNLKFLSKKRGAIIGLINPKKNF